MSVLHFVRRHLLLALLALTSTAVSQANDDLDPQIQSLLHKGSYADAEKLLKQQIQDPTAPVTEAAAVQLEIIRRTRQDFSLSADDVLKQIRASVPDATLADMDKWREAGDLQARLIDGELRYFRSAASNLFRFNADARKRRSAAGKPGAESKKFDTTAHVKELVRLSASADAVEVFPVTHLITYELSVNEGNPRLKPGAVVKAWLPFPHEYRQQRNVQLLESSPPGGKIARNDAPQRTVYFEQTLGDALEPPRFRVKLQYDTSAYCPKLDPAAVEPYDLNSPHYLEYTFERAPHIVFTPEVRRIAREAVGDETNPLEKARRIFRWVSHNIPWCSEMEYSIIPNISAKGLAARRGDCGVAALTFITLCRAEGVPARWQSGWQARPGDWNMHDWAEFYVDPWGWLPADPSYGVRDDPDPQVQDFFCGHIDPYRMIVNLDYARPLEPPKTSFRSEPNDFQRGEIEIDGHNLYFNEWDWKFQIKTTPREVSAKDSAAPSSAAGK